MAVLIFDLDGTIVNSSADVLVSMEFALQTTGLVPTRQLDSTLIGPPLPQMVREAVDNASDDDVARVIAAFRAHYDDSQYSRTELYPGVRALLEALGSLRAISFLATNKPRKATVAILERLEVRPAFADIVCIGDDRAAGKTEMVGELLRRNSPVYGGGWMIGDAVADIQAGKTHGLRTVAHLGGYSAPRSLLAQAPDIAVERMDQLLPLLLLHFQRNNE